MSDEAIIRVENLGKKYRIQHQQNGSTRYKTLRDAITETFAAPFKALHRIGRSSLEERVPGSVKPLASRSSSEDFWAVRNVSFEVKRGEVLGVIGRNGAGKSTLLKILSRITEPTEGRVRIKGRVASLLEVGTGFHPELTGRENIFLNGAILGMSRAEIRKKFDEIVAFSEVEKFLDTPVKRYSSGMYVRLAFAVAAHLEPEILIVDEVLAVGDAQFQKKCLRKMQDVSRQEGRAVLFVSHNMAAVSSMTDRVALMDRGSNVFTGATERGIKEYLKSSDQGCGAYDSPLSNSSKPFVSQIRVNSAKGEAIHISGQNMVITVVINHADPIRNACFSFQIVNQYQHPVVHCWIYDIDTPICREGQSTILTCRMPSLALNVGAYTLTTFLSEPPGGQFFEKLEGICPFQVEIIGSQTLFGWRPDACGYITAFEWTKH